VRIPADLPMPPSLSIGTGSELRNSIGRMAQDVAK